MKKLLLTILLSSTLLMTYGQIIPEATYNHSGTYTNMSVSGYKFYVMDVGANQCRIFNTNHTLWKTINLTVPANHYLYDIRFVSENLFTNDNTLCLAYIYYNYNTTGQYYTYTARVIRENGTELLNIPGCQYLYLHKINTLGTKLVAYSFNYSTYPNYTVQTHVYNLPGQLPSGADGGTEPLDLMQFARPNPADNFTIIPFSLPKGVNEGELVITDSKGQSIRTIQINSSFESIRVETAQFPRGIYLYYISAGNYRSETSKLVVQ